MPLTHALFRSIRHRTAAVLCLALLSSLGAGAAEPATTPPNVLLIAVDDLNDWIGVLGAHPDVRTPNIDRLTKSGVLFTRAYCAAPSCNPSRTALLTGVRPSTSGVYENDQPWRPVLPHAVTLPQHFMANGYHVAGVGKIFHGGYNDDQSWHEYMAPPGSPSPVKRSMEGTGHFDWGAVNAGDEEMGDYKVVTKAIEHLNTRHGKPLFLAVGFTRPHLPWYAPKKYFDMYPLDEIALPEVQENDLADVPEAGRKMAKPGGDHRRVVEAGQWKQAVQGYLASITFADAQIGRLVDALERSPFAKNTIVVLWSDHGWHLGEKEHWRKFSLWEEGNRVTFSITAPGVTQPGQHCGRTVGLMDIYPTLVELCGLPQKANLEATSLVPLLKDPNAKWDRPALMTYHRGNHAVRSERWRYIRYADGSEELYDHEADPREWKNLATDPQWSQVKSELRQWLPKTDAADAPTRAAQGKRGKGKKKN